MGVLSYCKGGLKGDEIMETCSELEWAERHEVGEDCFSSLSTGRAATPPWLLDVLVLLKAIRRGGCPYQVPWWSFSPKDPDVKPWLSSVVRCGFSLSGAPS